MNKPTESDAWSLPGACPLGDRGSSCPLRGSKRPRPSGRKCQHGRRRLGTCVELRPGPAVGTRRNAARSKAERIVVLLRLGLSRWRYRLHRQLLEGRHRSRSSSRRTTRASGSRSARARGWRKLATRQGCVRPPSHRSRSKPCSRILKRSGCRSRWEQDLRRAIASASPRIIGQS